MRPSLDTVDDHTAVPLTALAVGARGRLARARDAAEAALLAALGLSRRAPFLVCKSGNPWILQVRGTKVGLVDAVADGLMVLPEPSELPRHE
jgi:hypothetical protein